MLAMDFPPRNELDIVVSKSAKSASYGHSSLVCGLWLAGGGRGGSVPTYDLVHSTNVFLVTRATIWKNRKAHCTFALSNIKGIFFFCPRANLPAAGRFARLFLAGSLFSLLTTIDHRQTLID
jgi:hypothetical protein